MDSLDKNQERRIHVRTGSSFKPMTARGAVYAKDATFSREGKTEKETSTRICPVCGFRIPSSLEACVNCAYIPKEDDRYSFSKVKYFPDTES